jgi:hypothetical protein
LGRIVNAEALRTALDDLLQLTPVEPHSKLRILEIETDPQSGASAAELAARSSWRA